MRQPTLVLCTLTALTLANFATAQSPAGTWTLYPPQVSSYTTAVQPPINADGTSNFKSTGKSVIPVKFSLATAPGPVIFQSIGSDTDTTNDYSYLSFAPTTALAFNQLTNLSAQYTFTEGDCHGGALRWSIGISPTTSLFIYYGAEPNTTNCTTEDGGVSSQSGLNMIGRLDLRYDTSQLGGTFYDTYAHALALIGSTPITSATLVLDGGWGGDQVVTPSNVTVNTNTFVPAGGGSVLTCTLPPATIQITKLSGSTTGAVNEPLTIQPADNNSQFRVVGCNYMYNLDTSSLSGAGRYEVGAVIGGTPATGVALFDLR
jgi:hypothetical protein